MDWLRKLPGFQQTPYGLEWRLLRSMPWVGLAGTVLPGMVCVAARFLMSGDNAAELARRLYISPKTAAVHVSNILHKLGVSSRTEVIDLVRG